MALVQAPPKSPRLFETPPKNTIHVGTVAPQAAIANGSQPGKAKKNWANHGDASQTDRTILLKIEGSEDCLSMAAKTSTRVEDVLEFLAPILKTEPHVLQISRPTIHGPRVMHAGEEVASQAIISGFKSISSGERTPKQYEHPIVIIGGGLGGIQSMVDLQRRGRQFVCIEKLEDFGGASWMTVSNRFTKLQTEKGTYHVDYIKPEATVPKNIDDDDYKTWPSRDLLLKMFREAARRHGLYDATMFHTRMEKVLPNKDGSYAVYHVNDKDPDADAVVTQAAAVCAWPGNLCKMNKITFPGEEDFGGYIEYSSFDILDYTKTERKEVILYGHGAFTIENVRTLVEHKVKKVWVLCRRRNLCGMKMVSWVVGQSEIPISGNIMLDLFQRMYDLVGYDVWSCHSVQTDAKRSFAHITQKTVFGVTDVYFLAGYFGLMEVVVDEIEKLSFKKAHLKNSRKTIDCEVVIKAIGTSPDFVIDKQLGIKELVGMWINGDPLRTVNCNGMFVQARNFGSFSSGPGFAPMVKCQHYFIDFPEEFAAVAPHLPRQKAGERPAYVPTGTFMMPMMMALQANCPYLAQQMNEMDGLKARKQREAHPMREFLAECKAEWAMYIKTFRDNGMVDDRPDPPYPYTEEIMLEAVAKSDAQYMATMEAQQARRRG